MAETAAAAAPTAEKAQPTTRPTRPDEGEFQKALTEAEKAHKASMDRLVSGTMWPRCQCVMAHVTDLSSTHAERHQGQD